LAIDTLKLLVEKAKDDTTRIDQEARLAERYAYYNPDSSLHYARIVLQSSQTMHYLYGEFLAYLALYHYYFSQADYSGALQAVTDQLAIAEKLPTRHDESIAWAHMHLGHIYRIMKHYEEALAHQNLSDAYQQSSGVSFLPIIHNDLGRAYTYLNMRKPDTARIIFDSLMAKASTSLGLPNDDSTLWKIRPYVPYQAQNSWAIFFAVKGSIQENLQNRDQAELTYKDGIANYFSYPHGDNQYYLMRLYINLANLYTKTGKIDSSIRYARLAFQTSEKDDFLDYKLSAAKILAQDYEANKKQDSLVKYMRQIIVTNDSVFSQARLRQFQSLEFSEKQRQQEINAAKERYQNQVRVYGLLAALGVFLLIAFILFRNNRQKQRANMQLNSQKLEIEKTLSTLKDTQNQLIHAEKMASLGELTAGIAHEIQNPLNFVNNFSEVNGELFDEMEMEFKNGNAAEAFSIASNIRQNLEKINEHGKRADSIVKGMLLHSRISSGHKESIDLNALAEEYLRLSYHGMRAKDKTFNCEIRTDLDKGLCHANLVPQDIARVFMNIYNNAFYSLAEKMKKVGDQYKPMLAVRTKKTEADIEISIRDNGLGIPTEINGKIFQPFFTTKPTGQGTGLGLSLSYDIIVKEHGGSISLNSEAIEGAEFLIKLPVR
jgi:signal transduction histidine kinase